VFAFAYRNSTWIQVPVQVDERHTIDVRQLYPAGNHPPYVGNDDPDFDLEVYADPKTRSGADADTKFDADDELTFMGSDTGSKAPSGVGAPAYVIPGSGTAVQVKDPVGGGKAWLYLFTSKLPLDQSAGKDYVKYKFKLTNLTGGQTLKDDYGYFHSTNPEDSTVTTKNYRLHSTDRWNEDQLHVTAGNSGGQDILDREVAQATRFACVRSESTFSGNWVGDLDPTNDAATDDEGTYVAVIDGPVRAIRSYMGANSGPYVQREHIYYRDREDNTIYLRVHTMTDLYSWTDYSEAAIGMKYRDSKNPAGVTVDGEPDTLTPTTSDDIGAGKFAWQQLSGPQGTVSSVMGTETDIPDAAFGNYYLDDSTPTGVDERQCGGDGKSIGASGFGILGPITPNTDPRNGAHNNLTTERVRYFGPPSDGAAKAEGYTARVSEPLAASTSASPRKAGAPAAIAKLVNKNVTAYRGRKISFRLKVINKGNFDLRAGKLCVKAPALATKPCVKFKGLRIGKSRVVTLKTRVKRNAKGKRITLTLKISGGAGDWGFGGVGYGISVPLKG